MEVLQLLLHRNVTTTYNAFQKLKENSDRASRDGSQKQTNKYARPSNNLRLLVLALIMITLPKQTPDKETLIAGYIYTCTFGLHQVHIICDKIQILDAPIKLSFI